MLEFVLYFFTVVAVVETTVDVGTKTYDTVSTVVQEVLADEEPVELEEEHLQSRNTKSKGSALRRWAFL